jgi:hypothetical protein
MKLLQSVAFLFLLMACNNAIGQSLKITSIGSEDNVSYKLIEKQIVGKKLELTLCKDSAIVFIAALHQKEKMKQINLNQYMRTDSTDKDITLSLLTVHRTQTQLLSINLRLVYLGEAGDKMEIWLIAKP